MTHDSTIWAAGPVSRIAPGTRLNGIYEIDYPIGAGGMGEIYRGHAIQTGDAVAIKVIRPDLAENEAALALFRKEASVLHNLLHDAIVRYYVFSVDPAIGRPYLSMEFVDGPSLSEVLRKGPLAYEAVRSLQRRLAAGLQAAHELGVVHRDMSPDNVILPASDVTRAKIIDFGIARTLQIGGGTIIGGGFAGKHNYASPEQLGLYGGEVTAKSDIYSLGLVLAEALSGQAIDMSGTQVELVEKRRRPPDLSHIDERMRALLEWMLQPDPAARPESMTDVAEWRNTTPTAVSTLGAENRSTQFGRTVIEEPEKQRRTPVAAIAAALTAIVLLGGGAAVYALGLWPWKPDPIEELIATQQTEDAESANEPLQIEPIDPGGTPATGESLPEGEEPIPPQEGTNTAGQDITIDPEDGETPEPVIEDPPVSPPEPPPPPPVEEPPLTRVAQVSNYISGYDGGECFFVASPAVSETGGTISANMEVFGASVAAAGALDEGFKEANGFEAQIFLRQVNEAQCAAVTFLDRVPAKAELAPQLSINAFQLAPGETLRGTSVASGGRHTELLLVSGSGVVKNITEKAVPEGGGMTFEVPVERNTAAGAEPQLLLAVTTDEPLALPPSTAPAESYFPLLRAEAERTGQDVGVAVKYFKVEG
jgi:serine/threonine-protein kinase